MKSYSANCLNSSNSLQTFFDLDTFFEVSISLSCPRSVTDYIMSSLTSGSSEVSFSVLNICEMIVEYELLLSDTNIIYKIPLQSLRYTFKSCIVALGFIAKIALNINFVIGSYRIF